MIDLRSSGLKLVGEELMVMCEMQKRWSRRGRGRGQGVFVCLEPASEFQRTPHRAYAKPVTCPTFPSFTALGIRTLLHHDLSIKRQLGTACKRHFSSPGIDCPALALLKLQLETEQNELTTPLLSALHELKHPLCHDRR